MNGRDFEGKSLDRQKDMNSENRKTNPGIEDWTKCGMIGRS